MTMTNWENWEALLTPCECAAQYTIEPHGKGYALYHGRCGHRHGYNLAYITEPAANCDLAHIERLLNVGDSFVKEGFL